MCVAENGRLEKERSGGIAHHRRPMKVAHACDAGTMHHLGDAAGDTCTTRFANQEYIIDDDIVIDIINRHARRE